MRRWLPLALPALLAMAVHVRGLSHQFMSDDPMLVTRNPQVTEPGRLRELLTTDWFDTGQGGRIGYWRPVVKLSLRATWAVAGPSPFAFHLGNLLAHAAAAALLAGLLVPVAGRGLGVAAASLFAAHPMTVQAVQIVTARSDVLAAVFCLAALAAVSWRHRGGGPGSLAVLAAATLLAVGSKESAFLLPLVVLAWGLALGMERRRLLGALGVVLLVEVPLLLVRQAVLGVSPSPNALIDLAPGGKALYVLSAIGTYARSLVLATPIVTLPRGPSGLLDPHVLAGLAAVALSAWLVARDRFRSLASFAVAFSTLSIGPALAVWWVQIPRWRDEVPVAERWLYMPTVGFAILAALLFRALPGRGPALASCALVALFGGVTFDRTGMYRSQEALAEWMEDDLLAARPEDLNPRQRYFAARIRAAKALRAGEMEAGLGHLLEADAIAPALPDHLPMIAQAELNLGRPGRAAAALERLLSPAFAVDPALVGQRRDFGNDTLSRLDRAPALNLLGQAYARLGRARESLLAFEGAARLAAGRADEAAYLVDLGVARRESGDPVRAREAFERAAALKPGWSRPALELRKTGEAAPPAGGAGALPGGGG